MDSEVTSLGELRLDGKQIAKLFGLCVVENLITLREEALISAEYTSGEVTLCIVPVAE